MKAALSFQPVTCSAQSESLIDSLLQAAKLGDSPAIEKLIAEGVNVNAASEDGTTALMMAASAGQLKALRLLQERGATLNQTRSDGFSALSLAVFFGHEEIVRQLVTQGADIDVKGRGQATAETWATARGFASIAELLRSRKEAVPEVPAAPELNSQEVIKEESQPPHQEPVELESNENDDLFDEGIRKVGQKEWTTTPGLPTDSQVASASEEIWEEDIRRVSSPRLPASEPRQPTEKRYSSIALLASSEGIRRVGQNNAGAVEPADYCPPAEGKSFSALSTLNERLGLKWKHAVVLTVIAVALGVALAVFIWKLDTIPAASTEEAFQPASESTTSQGSEAPVAPAAVPVSSPEIETAQEVKSESAPAEENSAPTVTIKTQETKVPDPPKPVVSAANHAITAEGVQRNSNPRKSTKVVTKPSRNRRDNGVAQASASEQEPTRQENQTADFTFSKPTTPVRKATPGNDTAAQPATLIEGSSTKKKVIQWP